MATRKQEAKVEVVAGICLRIWADNFVTEDIMSIEGIVDVMISTRLPWIAYVDKRYDIQEIKLCTH